MAVFVFDVEPNKFIGLETLREEDLDAFMDGFGGQSMSDAWTPIAVRLVPRDVSAGQLKADFADIPSSVPVLSGRAVKELADLLEGNAEALPLSSSSDPYFALNVTTVLDVMDEATSVGDYYAPGRLARLERLALTRPVETLPPIFKLRQWLKGSPIITSAFVDRVESQKMTGLDARPILAS